ncbi:MAG: anaerobic sulfatase maturase [Deltaproteobacteria bacterium]|nr:anaerobic sulfatase maturase [Deltaproteobacteria bacterium]
MTERWETSMKKASHDFQVFAKPAGAVCNLECRYCYYLQKESLYLETDPFCMPDDLLEDYIAQQIAGTPDRNISFFWHGGEPTVLGLDYFRKIVALQKKHQPPETRITNNIQTNGILITEDWCRFFAEEGFSVGLSMDGPAALHDVYRVTKGQKRTHRQVMQAYRLLKHHRVPCDILCVVHDRNVREPSAVYRFFKEIKAQYISFIPLVERDGNGGNTVTDRTVPADALGLFLSAIFDEWVRQDMGRMIVQIFEEAARPAYGQTHSLCIFRPTCGDVPVIEHNGDFYACDHLVDPAHRLGNIRETPLVSLVDSAPLKRFGESKRDTLPRYCRDCDVLALCNGGCPKDRIIKTPDGENGLNYLCAGYKQFFTHCRPYTLRMAALRMAGQRPERLMRLLQTENAATRSAVGRNDPCPCGSGKKYKKCCMNAGK